MTMFTATGGYYTPQYDSVQEYIEKGWYRSMETWISVVDTSKGGFSTNKVTIPSEEVWDELAQSCTVGVKPESNSAQFGGRMLEIQLNVVVGKDALADARGLKVSEEPFTFSDTDWQEIIALSKEAATEKEKYRYFSSKVTHKIWIPK